MGRFEIGDKVRIVHPPAKFKEREGEIMVIVGTGYGSGEFFLAGDGKDCTQDRPEMWSERYLEHVRFEIVIYRAGDSVTAENYLTGKKTTLKCGLDKESFEGGARVAFDLVVDVPARICGYPVKELIAFAEACRKHGVEDDDLARFARGVMRDEGDHILWNAVRKNAGVFSGGPGDPPLRRGTRKTAE